MNRSPGSRRAAFLTVGVIGIAITLAVGAIFLLSSGGDDVDCESVANRPITQFPMERERFDRAFEGIEENAVGGRAGSERATR